VRTPLERVTSFAMATVLVQIRFGAYKERGWLRPVVNKRG
jgi:hypothetical protein